jgi:hypothetical protein
MLPAANGNFQLLDNSKPSDSALATATSYRYSSYFELPAGKYKLGVAKAGSSTPIKVLDLDVQAERYFTILIAPQRIDVFDDTVDTKTQSGTLTIRNFLPGVAVTASVGQTALPQPIAYAQSYSAPSLPLARTTVTVRGTLLDGKHAEASADIDFSSNRRATALVIQDAYGDFRLRITPDGKNP